MYEGIFEDFEIIKRHCRNNGNVKFEESTVFELLESLAPQHGTVQAVQMVLEMLDAQTVRDCNLIKLETIQSDDSNDSIIEVQVPKKNHPIIDLTDDSIQVNETSVIEKAPKSCINIIETESDSNSHDNYFGDQTDNELSDSDGPKFVEDYLNERGFNAESRLSEILALFEDSNQSNQMESSEVMPRVSEVPEMLEENNNDPNNNLDGTIFEEELVEINNGNNSDRLHFVSNVAESSNSNILRIIDPVPGCSKDTEDRLNTRINNIPNNQPSSPVPGCSKDFDNSNDFELPHVKHDESIIDDALCIQNLLHWAKWETIQTILEKYRDSPNRKQLALWDLMNEASSKPTTDNTDNKRKQDDDLCTASKKSMKMEVDIDDNLEDLLDLSTNSLNAFDSIICNESNDSVSNSELSSDIIKENQNGNVSVASESSNVIHCNRTDDDDFIKKEVIGVSNQLINNENRQSQLNKTDTCTLPKTMNLNNTALSQFPHFSVNFAPKVKKEKIETVVSGSLNSHSTIQAEETKSKANNITFHNLNNKEKQYLDNSNLTRNIVNGTEIKQELNALEHLINYDKKVDEEMSSKSERINLIKPAKLNISHKPLPLPYNIVRPSERISYIRPPVFTLLNNDISTKAKNEVVYKIPDQSERAKQIQNEAVPLAGTHNFRDVNQPSSSSKKSDGGVNIEYAPKDELSSQVPPPKKFIVPSHFNFGAPIIRSNLIKLQPPKIISTPRIVKGSNEAVPLVTIPAVPNIVNSTPAAVSSDPEGYDRLIYTKLRSIFPGIKSSYIKKICKSPPVLIDMNNKSQAISILIDHLLEEGNKHMQPVTVESAEPKPKPVLSIDEQYEYLLGVFPDADPTYLRKFVEKNINKENVFEQFIQEQLETHNYPTKAQYLAKIKITEQIKTYTTDFNVEKFLQMFPDPFKYFEDAKRICVHQPIAMEFLKSHFHKNKVTTICRFYTTNKYNLSLTAKALTNLGYDMKSKRMSAEMPTEDIPLLQEMAFIKHKENIINYINSKKAAEEQMFKELQEKNLLLTCQCCFNEECMPTKCVECNNKHVFCNDCLIRGTEMALANGEAHVKCFTECQNDFSLATLQKVLSPTTFSALLKKRQAAEVQAAEVEGLVSCPFCHFASIPPPEDKVFKCLNPECMKETCRQCKELNHVPLKCDEVIKTDKARLLIEEKMTEALVRICYKCKRQFYKEDGCNKMRCTCGAIMCYVCSKPIKGYNHFNAQGGVNSHLCPLWSDDKRLNAEVVRKVAEDYKKVILKDNPNLQIDTEPLLPKLPPRSRGPHDDIPNANQIPEYVRRVIAGP